MARAEKTARVRELTELAERRDLVGREAQTDKTGSDEPSGWIRRVLECVAGSEWYDSV
jgi:hypothetical protein